MLNTYNIVDVYMYSSSIEVHMNMQLGTLYIVQPEYYTIHCVFKLIQLI